MLKARTTNTLTNTKLAQIDSDCGSSCCRIRLFFWIDDHAHQFARLTRPHLDQLLGLVVTAILLLSSFFMNRGKTAMSHGDKKSFMNNTGHLCTWAWLLLGVVLVGGAPLKEGSQFGNPAAGTYGCGLLYYDRYASFHVLTGLSAWVWYGTTHAESVFCQAALGCGSRRSLLALRRPGVDFLLSALYLIGRVV